MTYFAASSVRVEQVRSPSCLDIRLSDEFGLKSSQAVRFDRLTSDFGYGCLSDHRVRFGSIESNRNALLNQLMPLNRQTINGQVSHGASYV